MAHSNRHTAAEVKARLLDVVSAKAIEQLCRAVGHQWRQTVLNPVTTTIAFLMQVLHGNAACDEVPELMKLDVLGEAYCKARARLPLAVFEGILKQVCHSLSKRWDAGHLWQGHRVWHLDGTAVSMPDTPELQQAFGQPGNQVPGCGFPVAHLMTLFHATTGYLQQTVVAPLRTHDMALAPQVHSALQANDVVVGDRGFCSYAHMAMLAKLGVFFVFRAHQRLIIDFRRGRACDTGKRVTTGPKDRRTGSPQNKSKCRSRPRSTWIEWLGVMDQLVEYRKPQLPPGWMSAEEYAQLPDTLVVRELRYEVPVANSRTRTITLVTSLVDQTKYSKESLAQLYFERWQIETNLRHLKTTMGMDVLKSKTKDGILKELTVFAIAYNLVRDELLVESESRGIAVTRISFIDALRSLKHGRLRQRRRNLKVLPLRPGRTEPRVRKRRPKTYPLMRRPRCKMKQVSTHQRLRLS